LDFLNLFKKTFDNKQPEKAEAGSHWIKCKSCHSLMYYKEVENQNYVCPKCGYHIRIGVKERIKLLADEGTARMQESTFSLLQMSKTSAALGKLSNENLPFISVLTDPTMGGVSASFANLGDIIIAEPGALVGFAGARVIEQTIGSELPEGFQRAEFLLEKGSIDMIVNRNELKKTLADLLRLMKND